MSAISEFDQVIAGISEQLGKLATADQSIETVLLLHQARGLIDVLRAQVKSSPPGAVLANFGAPELWQYETPISKALAKLSAPPAATPPADPPRRRKRSDPE